MKKNRILSILLVLVMTVSLLTGCTKTKQTMFTVTEDASSMEQYSYNVDVNLKSTISGAQSATLSVYGDVSGTDCTMSVKVKYSLFSIEAKNIIIIKGNSMYINFADLLETLIPLIPNAEEQIAQLESELGFKINCFQLPIDKSMLMNSEQRENILKLSNTILEESLADFEIEENKGEFSVSIDSTRALARFVDAFFDSIIEHKDEIKDLYKDIIDESIEPSKKLAESYMNEIITVMEEYAKEDGAKITQDEIDEVKSTFKEQMDEAFQSVDFDEFYEMLDEAFTEIEDAKDDIVSEIKENEEYNCSIDYNNSLTGKKGKRVFTSNLSVEISDETEKIAVTVESVMEENKDVEIEAPETYTSFTDFIRAAIKAGMEQGGVSIVEPETQGTAAVVVEPETATQEAVVEVTTEEVPTEEVPTETEEVTTDEADRFYAGSIVLDCEEDGFIEFLYNTDIVAVEKDYCDPEYGYVTFQFAEDEFQYLMFMYQSGDYKEDIAYKLSELSDYPYCESIEQSVDVPAGEALLVYIRYGESAENYEEDLYAYYLFEHGFFEDSCEEMNDLEATLNLLQNSFVNVNYDATPLFSN